MNKKVLFVIAMLVCAAIVVFSTDATELSYNFPLDGGVNKLCAAFMATCIAFWASLTDIRASVLLWIVFLALIEVMFGVGAMLSSGFMFGVTRIMVDANPEIKEYIMSLFGDDDDEDDD